MNKEKFRRGLTTESTSYGHLRGRLDSEALLEDLGIDISHRLSEHQIMCHCPNITGLHMNGDANPSFGFNGEKLAFNCFICGGGNIVELVQMMRPELTQDKAIEYLEQFSDLTPDSPEDLQTKIQKILNPKDNTPIMPEYPEDNLFQYQKIHPYLYERGLTKEIIIEMQVGFDEEHCGIVIPHLFMGKLRGWQTRHLVEDPKGVYHCEVHSCNFKKVKDTEKKIAVAKYKNTPNFPKINSLYGYDRFKQKRAELHDVELHHVNESSNGRHVTSGNIDVIVVESPMTALKLISMGFDNVVATFGQFNNEQGMLLLNNSRVYFWPDNDSAGRVNTTKFINSLSRYTRVYIVPVVDKPKGDAADLPCVEEVRTYLSHAWAASLYPIMAKPDLPTLEEVQQHDRWQKVY